MASGHKLSEETRRKMSEDRKRRGVVPPSWLGKKRGPQSEEHKRKLGEAKRGKKIHSEKHKEVLRKRMTGNKIMLGRKLSSEHKLAIALAGKGRRMPEATRLKLSVARRREGNPAWKGGLYKAVEQLRRSPEYREWTKTVYQRDEYTCQMCGRSNCKVEANHIKRFADYPELRFVVVNGITLCQPCHRSINGNEQEWESYFNFNLMARGFIEDEHSIMKGGGLN